MIIVSSAKREEIDRFNEEEWHGVDIEHYGKGVEWNEQTFIFKATENNQIVGTITGKHESGVLYIHGLIVGKTYRGKGVGKSLIAQAEAFGKEKGAHKSNLQTGKSWEAAKFYEAVGYIKVADLPNHHFHTDFVIYEKAL